MCKKTKPIMYLYIITAFIFFILAVSGIIYKITQADIVCTIHITFITIAYHFIMRILVGEGITAIFRYREFHYDATWYKSSCFEQKFYKLIKIKKWKSHLITAKPEQFDIKSNSYDELLHNITQAEIVHEIIMLLSFVPLFFIIPFGSPLVFIITSVIACLVDFIFVMVQRFNRPRLIKIKKLLKEAPPAGVGLR